MGKVKRRREAGHPVRTKPFVRDPDVGPETKTFRIELAEQRLKRFREEFAVLLEIQVSKSQRQKLGVGALSPILRAFHRWNEAFYCML